MGSAETTRIPVTKHTRDEVLTPLKQGDETYDELLVRLARAYVEAETDESEKVIRHRAPTIEDIGNEVERRVERVIRNELTGPRAGME